ncbi:hypothetical protein LTR86_000531 [Recurvomyces mirabilis]|nr:hypothetical protein LTR86_000531 [Recurvomyces mirabilis]
MGSIHQVTRLSDIATLMESTNHSDLVIRCNGKQFHVHKAILCSASRVFSKACDKKFEEGVTGVIEHTQFDADTVERMIEYIYKQTYHVDSPGPSTESSNCSTEPSSPTEVDGGGTEDDQAPSEPSNAAEEPSVDTNTALIAHARVYAIGEYYELPTLQQMAMERFEAEATSSWSVDSFIDVIKEVNALTSLDDRALRNKLRGVAMEHLDQLVNDDDFMTELAELQDVQDFAADMLRATVKHYKDELTVRTMVCAMSSGKVIVAAELNVQLQDRVNFLEARAKADRQEITEAYERARDVVDNLQTSITELPGECANVNCERKFDPVYFEKKGQMGLGGLYTDWWIRCSRCRCRLNK